MQQCSNAQTGRYLPSKIVGGCGRVYGPFRNGEPCGRYAVGGGRRREGSLARQVADQIHGRGNCGEIGHHSGSQRRLNKGSLALSVAC